MTAIRELGRGAFGTVWLMREAASGTEFARKEVGPQGVESVRRELRVLRNANHEGIIKLVVCYSFFSNHLNRV